MRLTLVWTTSFLIASLSGMAYGQSANHKPAVPATEAKGMPPRATPADYQAQAKAGEITVAAEFTGHSVPRPEGPLSTEDYVVVETGLFGAEGARIKLSVEDFTLRVNGKKSTLSSQPYGFVTASLKDPEWVAPEEAQKKEKSKTGISTGGQSDSGSMPVIVHVPIELRRAMALYVQKSALPEGDRPLPVAGLIFFPYRGGVKGIHSLELLYSGPSGQATLSLQP